MGSKIVAPAGPDCLSLESPFGVWVTPRFPKIEEFKATLSLSKYLICWRIISPMENASRCFRIRLKKAKLKTNKNRALKKNMNKCKDNMEDGLGLKTVNVVNLTFRKFSLEWFRNREIFLQTFWNLFSLCLWILFMFFLCVGTWLNASNVCVSRQECF